MASRSIPPTSPGTWLSSISCVPMCSQRRRHSRVHFVYAAAREVKCCIDIVTQVSAMTRALQGVSLGVLEEHLSHCVVGGAKAGGKEAEAKVREASQAIA